MQLNLNALQSDKHYLPWYKPAMLSQSKSFSGLHSSMKAQIPQLRCVPYDCSCGHQVGISIHLCQFASFSKIPLERSVQKLNFLLSLVITNLKDSDVFVHSVVIFKP